MKGDLKWGEMRTIPCGAPLPGVNAGVGSCEREGIFVGCAGIDEGCECWDGRCGRSGFEVLGSTVCCVGDIITYFESKYKEYMEEKYTLLVPKESGWFSEGNVTAVIGERVVGGINGVDNRNEEVDVGDGLLSAGVAALKMD